MLKMYDEAITPGMTPLDTGLASIERDRVRAKLGPIIAEQQQILERIKTASFAYLIEVEAQILAGQDIPDAVAAGRSFVEAELGRRVPAALDALKSAQERLATGDHEALSQAAGSCRRTIKALADALFPPTSPTKTEDGLTVSLDDDHYRNRLIEYVRQEKRRSTHADLLISNLNVLSTRLKSLDDLASKGVHTRVSAAEAESCVSWTYMLAADLLRVALDSDANAR
ncbi:hypothetical protein [Microbacterium lacus]|uniref:hypothetical protein n=1 Tax=Microbacterium lacus TaxID=415217 RepID=UPI0012FD9FB0|nr:hypothetical protein [Microbacterium lacus]